MAFKLTYSTMFTPPEEMQLRFEAALAKVEGNLGREGRLLIAGKDVATLEFADRFSPIDPALHLGSWAVGGPEEADKAMAAAKAAFPAWRATPPRERLRLLRSVAFLLEERVYEIAAAMVLEVGKNRMEALGETQETADFFTLYSSLFEQADGYALTLPDDPLPDFRSHNRSVLKPHGVWVVIAPFNFPLALAGGPTAAALVTGNTVVLKGSSETFWAGRLLADCLRDAGIPPGVFNYVSGSGGVVGEALIRHPDLAGVPSPVPMRWGWTSTARWPQVPGLGHAFWRWVGKTLASSPPRATWSGRQRGSSVPPSAWGARSVRPCPGYTWRRR